MFYENMCYSYLVKGVTPVVPSAPEWTEGSGALQPAQVMRHKTAPSFYAQVGTVAVHKNWPGADPMKRWRAGARPDAKRAARQRSTHKIFQVGAA